MRFASRRLARGRTNLSNSADVVNTGTLDVSAKSSQTKAGKIVVIGKNVTNSGIIRADAVNGNAGMIELHATDTTKLIGNSITSATASGTGKGGTVKVLGNKVGLFDQASVDMSGANGRAWR